MFMRMKKITRNTVILKTKIYLLYAVGTVTVHTIAVIDGVLLRITVGCFIIADGYVVLLCGSTRRQKKEVGFSRLH